MGFNSQVLGYGDASIEKESFKLLIPSPIRENHDCLMKHSTSLFRPHSIFTYTHELYMIHKNKYLVPVYLKERIANSSYNKILMISSIKIHSYLYTFNKLTYFILYFKTKEFNYYLTPYSHCGIITSRYYPSYITTHTHR